MDEVPDQSPDFDPDRLWLPEMPSKTDIRKLKESLHPLMLAYLLRGTKGLFRKILKQSEPSDVGMILDDIYPKNAHVKKTKSQWKEVESEVKGAGKPTMSVSLYLQPTHLITTTEFGQFIGQISTHPTLGAELIASLPKKQRKIAANFLVADFVEDNDFLEDVLEDVQEDTAGDILEYDDIDDIDAKLVLITVCEFREAMIQGVFGKTEECPYFYHEGLLRKKFPREELGRKKKKSKDHKKKGKPPEERE